MEEPKLVRSLLSNKPRATAAIVSLGFILLIGIFSQLFWDGFLQNWPTQNGMIWQNFTATLIHADWGHYLSNAYMLFILGIFVYGYFGFTVYPVIGFLLAAITNFITVATYPEGVRLLGASGLVYVLAGFWLTMFWLVQRQHLWHRRLLRVLGVALVILFPTTFEPTVSYRAHSIGFVVGLLYALMHFSTHKDEIRRFEVWKLPESETEEAHITS